jgi:hypothetical protein
LKRVFRVLMINKNAPANTPDHWAVPSHKDFESYIFMSADEVLQQLSIRRLMQK